MNFVHHFKFPIPQRSWGKSRGKKGSGKEIENLYREKWIEKTRDTAILIEYTKGESLNKYGYLTRYAVYTLSSSRIGIPYEK